MVKDGNTRITVTLTPKSRAKLQYICDECGLRFTSVVNLAIETYYSILKKGKD